MTLMNGGFPGPSEKSEPPKGLADYRKASAEEEPVEAAQETEPEIDILEAEEETAEDTEEPEEPVETASDEPEEAPQGSRAEKRIRDLAAKNNQLQEALNALLESQVKTQQAEARRAEEQAALIATQRQQMAPEERARQMRQHDLDPTSRKDQALFELALRDEQREAKLVEMERTIAALRDERSQAKAETTIEQALQKKLAKYDVQPSSLPLLRDTVKDIAKAQGKSPEEAVEVAVARFGGLLKPKALKRSQPATEAMRTVSATGRSGGRTASRQPTSFLETLADLYKPRR